MPNMPKQYYVAYITMRGEHYKQVYRSKEDASHAFYQDIQNREIAAFPDSELCFAQLGLHGGSCPYDFWINPATGTTLQAVLYTP